MNHRDAIMTLLRKRSSGSGVISPFTQETITKYLVEPMGKGITSGQRIGVSTPMANMRTFVIWYRS